MARTLNLLPQPDLDKLHEDFLLDPASGKLVWNARRRGVSAGAIAGHCSHIRASLLVRISGKAYPVELLVWYMITGEWPRMYPRHRNGDRTDNSFSNLVVPPVPDHIARMEARVARAASESYSA